MNKIPKADATRAHTEPILLQEADICFEQSYIISRQTETESLKDGTFQNLNNRQTSGKLLLKDCEQMRIHE